MARRAGGLSQAEAARRAGTSQATWSAYERGVKAPSINVAARLLVALGFELTLRSRIDFTEHRAPGLEPFWVPSALWRVPTPSCFATLQIPDLIRSTEQNEWNLADPTDRRRGYEILVVHGLPQQMTRWLDGGFLVDLWNDLDLPEPIRRAWGPALLAATRRTTVDPFSWARAGDPEAAAVARVREYRPLPKPPPPPPPRRSRFDRRP